MVNVALVSLAMFGSGSFGLSSMRKVATMSSYPGLNRQGQNASTVITEDIRQASSIDSASSDRVVLKRADGKITYVYSATARTLTRVDAKGTQTILTDLESFSFSLFQRPAVGTAYGQFSPASATEARLLGCRWSCSRKLAGAKLDTETIELAPVVLRNRC